MLLEEHDLKFLGFVLPRTIKDDYKKLFPQDKSQLNLNAWEKFETTNPYILSNTYQFWVSRL